MNLAIKLNPCLKGQAYGYYRQLFFILRLSCHISLFHIYVICVGIQVNVA